MISPLTCHFRFLIVVLETLKLEKQCSQYLTLNPTCAKVHQNIGGNLELEIKGNKKAFK